MIVQELKLHAEPEPYKPPVVSSNSLLTNYGSYGSYTSRGFNQVDLARERTKAAMSGIKIGSKFKSRSQATILEVIGYETDPIKCEDIEGDPAIIRVRRTHPIDNLKDIIFHYSVEELQSVSLEKIA
jgi:hypothetical protein